MSYAHIVPFYIQNGFNFFLLFGGVESAQVYS